MCFIVASPVDSRQTEGERVKVDGDRAAAHPQATLYIYIYIYT